MPINAQSGMKPIETEFGSSPSNQLQTGATNFSEFKPSSAFNENEQPKSTSAYNPTSSYENRAPVSSYDDNKDRIDKLIASIQSGQMQKVIFKRCSKVVLEV